MNEPYATLFMGYETHWFLAPYLEGDEPDWRGIADDPRLEALSTGEKIILDFAAAFANLRHLDEANQYRATLALRRAL